MAYNPYDDLMQIYNYKSGYNKAKASNDTAGMQSAQDSAKQYYQNLRDNGYSDYADRMSGFTEQQAADFIKKLQPQATTQGTQGGVPNFTKQVGSALTDTVKKASGAVSGAYQGITPDILNWVTGIYDNKVLYDNAKYTDGSGDYQKYADAAKPFYQNLENAGRSDIAALLRGSDTDAALAYLRGLGVNLNPAQQDMSTIVNGLLTQPGNTFSIDDIQKLFEGSQPILDYITNTAKPDAATQAANQQALNNMNALFGMIYGNNQQNAQDSAILNELIKQYMGEQSARYDDLYSWLKNSNPYETDVAKSIMQYYNTQGGKAANEATAEGIAGNSGNIDSYAAANALRQQLDFTNAGNQAVLNQYNAQSAKMLDTLRALGVDVGDAQDRLIGILNGNQAYNADLAGKYNTGMNDVLGYLNENSKYQSDAAINTLGALLGLYESGMANGADVLKQQIQTGGDILANRDAQQALVDSSKATAEAEKEKARNEYMAEIQRILSDESISEQEIQQKMQEAYLTYEAKIYAADADASAKITDSYNSLEGTKYSADKKAESDKYVADKNAEADKYVADNKDSGEKNDPDSLGFDNYLYIFNNIRPEIKSENTALSDEQVDEATWREIGKVYGWSETEVKRYIEWYRSIADDTEQFIGPLEKVD